MSKRIACQFSLLIPLLVSAVHAADWRDFRGPTGDGHVEVGDSAANSFPLEWSESKNVRWKTPIPYQGWSTPVVEDGQIWLTTATEDGHDFYALCLDANSGKILHNEHLFHCDNPEPLGNNVNCYAACSPAIEPGRVYVHFGSYGTACLDTKSGGVLWKRDDMPCHHYRGPSSSVILFEDLVILTFDGADLQYVAALDKATGKTVWKTDRDPQWKNEHTVSESTALEEVLKAGDFRKAHSTPLVVTADGKPLLLSSAAQATFGYDPHTGKEIWHVQHGDFSAAPRPLYEDGVAFIVTGMGHRELWAVKTDGHGDVTDSGVLWRLKTNVAKTASPLLIDGLIYMVNDDGVASCVDAADGSTVWKKRIGGKHAASPIYADSRIYFFDQDGETTVLKPGREFVELAKNTLDDGFMASPAAADGVFYLRTKTNLYRIEDTP